MSFQFVLCMILSVSVLSTFVMPRRLKWISLLVASYAFYLFWSVPYILVLMVSTATNYLVALLIAHPSAPPQQKRMFLVIGIVLNMVLLFVFKYLSATLGLLNDLLQISTNVVLVNIILPVGISYYTFKGLSYIIDVYRGIMPAEHHVGLVTTYMAFFPQMIAGPIDRARTLLPQLREPAAWNDRQATEGFRLILWGTFKKLVLADRLAVYVNEVYAHPQNHAGLPLLLATIFFAFQVYADFSGYSDIAVGLAKVLGITSMENFRQPYFALSIREFWQRWHISLSSWIREYFFFPLARHASQVTRNRFPRLTQLLVNLIVMSLIGLWHGASLPFVVWGGMHGLYLSIEIWLNILLLRMDRLSGMRRHAAFMGRIGIVFVLVNFAWVFFRSNTISDALYVLAHLFAFSASAPGMGGALSPFGLDYLPQFYTVMGALLAVLAVDIVEAKWGLNTILEKLPLPGRWLIYYLIEGCVVVFGINAPKGFIYFQF